MKRCYAADYIVFTISFVLKNRIAYYNDGEHGAYISKKQMMWLAAQLGGIPVGSYRMFMFPYVVWNTAIAYEFLLV